MKFKSNRARGDSGGRGGRNFNSDKSFNANPQFGRPSPNGSNNGANGGGGGGYGASSGGSGGSMVSWRSMARLSDHVYIKTSPKHLFVSHLQSFSNQAANTNSSNNAGISTNQVTIPNDVS